MKMQHPVKPVTLSATLVSLCCTIGKCSLYSPFLKTSLSVIALANPKTILTLTLTLP